MTGRRALARVGQRIVNSALRMIALAIAVGLLAVVILGPGWAFAGPAEPPTREVTERQPSPSGRYVADVVHVSGGGAAGFQFQELRLRRARSESGVLVAERLYGVVVAWRGDDCLEVAFDEGTPGREDVDGVAIRYLRRSR